MGRRGKSWKHHFDAMYRVFRFAEKTQVFKKTGALFSEGISRILHFWKGTRGGKGEERVGVGSLGQERMSPKKKKREQRPEEDVWGERPPLRESSALGGWSN